MFLLILYLYTGLDILVLIHDWQDGLHAAVFHQVRLVAHKDQRYPEEKTFITDRATTFSQLINELIGK